MVFRDDGSEDLELDAFARALDGTSTAEIVALRQELLRQMNVILSDTATLNQPAQREIWDPEADDGAGAFVQQNYFPNQEQATNFADAIAFQDDELAKRGLDPFGAPLPAGSDGAATAQGNLDARFAELAERRKSARETERLRAAELEESGRQFNEEQAAILARQEENLAEDQRQTNITGTLDLLESGVRRGELVRAEAHDRMQAAAESARVQASTVAEFGGRNLPAGTEFFPNLGPEGPVAAAAAAGGFPFKPFATGGTFALDPAANAAPITQAVAGSQGSELAGSAAERAAAALAGLGLPGFSGAA